MNNLLVRSELLKLAACTVKCPDCTLIADKEGWGRGCRCHGTGLLPVFPELRYTCYGAKLLHPWCDGELDRSAIRRGSDARCDKCNRRVKGRHKNMRESTWNHALCCQNRIWSVHITSVAIEKLMLRQEFGSLMNYGGPDPALCYEASVTSDSEGISSALASHPYEAVILAFCAAYGIDGDMAVKQNVAQET